MTVKVWNDNTYPYSEQFRGEPIHIPSKSWIEMELYDAHQFIGQMPPNIKCDASGKQMAESYKMLRIENLGGAKAPQTKFICMQDGREFQTQTALDEYIRENHMDSIVDEKSKDEFKKKGPGRPKKVTNDTGGDRNSREA